MKSIVFPVLVASVMNITFFFSSSEEESNAVNFF